MIQLQGLKKSLRNKLIANMEQDLINAGDILPLEDRKERFSMSLSFFLFCPFQGFLFSSI